MTEQNAVSPPKSGWEEVAEIIGGEIEKNGRCAAETAWTLAGHLIRNLDIPGLKKKSNDKLDVTFAVKVIPELSLFASKRGRGQGIVLKSSIKTLSETESQEVIPDPNEALIAAQNQQVVVKPVLQPEEQSKTIINSNDDNDDSGFSTIPGSLLGRADDPRRPNLLPNFGDWAKKKEEPAFDQMLIGTDVWEVPRTNKLRGVIQTAHIKDMITEVFHGEENELGQICFLGKKFLISPENLAMFEKALWFVFGASRVIG